MSIYHLKIMYDILSPIVQCHSYSCKLSSGRCSKSEGVEEVMKQRAAQRSIIPPDQLEAIFHRLPDGIVVCDHEGKILRINAAALKLFEVDSDLFCIGIPYRQFLQAYLLNHDQQQQALSLDPWLMNLLTDA